VLSDLTRVTEISTTNDGYIRQKRSCILGVGSYIGSPGGIGLGLDLDLVTSRNFFESRDLLAALEERCYATGEVHQSAPT